MIKMMIGDVLVICVSIFYGIFFLWCRRNWKESEVKEESKWNKADESLPDYYDPVLVFLDLRPDTEGVETMIDIAFYNHEADRWVMHHNYTCVEFITHWQPLPDEPEVGQSYD
jgi:hypothetical protein